MKRLSYMRDILRALAYIHKKQIIHRDLKSANILITKHGAKIFDFGLSLIIESEPLVPKRVGTKCYFPPEAIFCTDHFTTKLDVWVCGLVIAETLANKRPLIPYREEECLHRQLVEFSGYS
jgi:serine/threonine protein kinase